MLNQIVPIVGIAPLIENVERVSRYVIFSRTPRYVGYRSEMVVGVEVTNNY
jgi:hypothetical protein